MHPIFQKYLETLMEYFQYDLHVMSKPWVIFTIIPIVIYLVFFFIKWAVLTTPLWMPFAIIASAARARRSGKNK